MRAADKVKERPAETASLAAGILAILALFGFHASPDERSAIIFAVSATASVVTFLVSRRNGNGTNGGGG